MQKYDKRINNKLHHAPNEGVMLRGLCKCSYSAKKMELNISPITIGANGDGSNEHICKIASDKSDKIPLVESDADLMTPIIPPMRN